MLEVLDENRFSFDRRFVAEVGFYFRIFATLLIE
jgi:hypothetical protein